MQLYNTLTRKVEEFAPLNPPDVSMYSCGLTVYDYAHIGNARTYINGDILKRALTENGFKVHHVMNITDVGHLESDEDAGEDKLEKGAKKHGKSPGEIAEFFTDYFLKTNDDLNILRPETIARATDHIQDMIQLVKTLQDKGYAYETEEGVYFDTQKFPEYGKLSGQKLEEKKQQARDDVYTDPQKKHSADFALWFKTVGRHAQHTMRWESPWGEGFPGWHIECSAMSMKYLGKTIDIHTGGIDHIPVHHENEIAQSECATGEQFVRFWFHSEFLLVDGQKMSKSKGNLFTLDDIRNKGIDPLALRYLFLQTHYRQGLNFTWDSLQAAQSALNKLRSAVVQLRDQKQRSHLSDEKLEKTTAYSVKFRGVINNDLHTPEALAVIWEAVKSNIPSEDKLDLVYDFDRILGLGLAGYEPEKHEIPQTVQDLAQERQAARAAGDYEKADQLRANINEQGYHIEDVGDGFIIRKSAL